MVEIVEAVKMSTNRWDKAGIPHTGWSWINVEDRGEASQECQMCSNERVRYIHLVAHAAYGQLEVGCVCAAAMCGEGGKRKKETMPYQREKRLKQAAAKETRRQVQERRKVAFAEFLKRSEAARKAKRARQRREDWCSWWGKTSDGSRRLDYANYYISAKFKDGLFQFWFQEQIKTRSGKGPRKQWHFVSLARTWDEALLQVHDLFYPSEGVSSPST